MERIEFYSTLEERAALLEAAKSLNETMVHDDFSIGPNGENRLTFNVYVAPPVTPEQRDRRDREDRLVDVRQKPTLTLPEVKSALDDIIDLLGVG